MVYFPNTTRKDGVILDRNAVKKSASDDGTDILKMQTSDERTYDKLWLQPLACTAFLIMIALGGNWKRTLVSQQVRTLAIVAVLAGEHSSLVYHPRWNLQRCYPPPYTRRRRTA